MTQAPPPMASGSDLIDMVGAVRARMGMIISASNRTIETQLRFAAPPQLGVHVCRMAFAARPRKPLRELIDGVVAAAQLLAAAKVDIIVLQASYIAMEDGAEGERKLIQTILDATGKPAMTSPQAMVEAMRSLGMRRIVIISPFQQASNELERAYLTDLGFDVLHDVALGVKEGDDTIAITPQRWVETAKAHARPDADGYFLSGSNTTIMQAIPLIEHALGRPAVSSTQATLWAAVRHLKPKLGAASFPYPLGRLFEHL